MLAERCKHFYGTVRYQNFSSIKTTAPTLPPLFQGERQNRRGVDPGVEIPVPLRSGVQAGPVTSLPRIGTNAAKGAGYLWVETPAPFAAIFHDPFHQSV